MQANPIMTYRRVLFMLGLRDVYSVTCTTEYRVTMKSLA